MIMPQEKQILDMISLDEIMKHVEILSQKPRVSGTPEEFEAFRYIQSVVNSYGIQNTMFPFRALLSYPVSGRVEVVSEENRPVKAKTRSYSACTPPEGVQGKIIYIPGSQNMFVDTDTKKRLESTDLRGKIVLTEGGGRQNMIFAQQKGAVGYIHMWPSDDPLIHESTVSPVWGPPTPEKLGFIPAIPVVAITNMDGCALRDAAQKGSCVVRLHTVTDTAWHNQQVLECNIPGRTDNFVMMGAHVDTWHHGVTDNLTGVALVIELLRVFVSLSSRLERGFRVCFWSGHSPGRYTGSTWYCDNRWDDLRRHCVTYLNVDMPGIKGTTDYPDVKASVETAPIGQTVIAELTKKQPRQKRPPRADDMSFWGVGLSILMSAGPSAEPPETRNLSGSPWFWHTEEDLIDKVGPDVLLTDTKIFALCSARLLLSPKLPLRIDNAVDELSALVRQYEAQARGLFDFCPVTAALDTLKGVVTRFETQLAVAENREEIDRLNQAMSDALKLLTTVSYTSVGEFEHDPAVPAVPLPLLADAALLPDINGDDINFTLTRLVRNRNSVVWHVTEATQLLLAALK